MAHEHEHEHGGEGESRKEEIIKLVVSAVLLVVSVVLSEHVLAAFFEAHWYLKLAMFLVPFLICGADLLKEALEGIFHGEVFDEDFLMAVATIGAIALGDYTEACAVMIFFKVGELFEDYAVDKSRDSISELMDIRPDTANLFENGNVTEVKAESVKEGSIVLVRPGEKVPLDGEIIEGETQVDTSALTGESVPRTVRTGDQLMSGMINLSGVIKVRTTKEFSESTASKILELVENAQEKKSKSENFITKFARVYTPAVCITALALAVVPSVISLVLGNGNVFGVWIYRALTFLVISCPCALVISIPLSFFAGLGKSSSEGILIKGSNYLEALSKTKVVVFDKTGTLTKGVFEVTDIVDASVDKDTLIELAACAEIHSNHPVALSVKKAYGKTPDENRVSDVKEIAGCGITAVVDGKKVSVGNAKLMESLNVDFKVCEKTGTLLYVSIDGSFAGCIVISDVVKESSKEALCALKKAGVEKTVMLTGDAEKVAKNVAEELGLDMYFAELLPGDKVSKVEMLLQELSGEQKLAFVGDGINDAPVLTRSDIGISMGALGSDAAIEASDVVLMDDDVMKLSRGIAISRKCIRIVYENIWFSIGIKFACLGLGALGLLNMWAAIFADVGVMCIAVFNAMRVFRTKIK
ncbi:MAG: cadmium-translocating P-type ATPase [Treponema sp.]|nr:cadmium-translocating P-type ATPase [Treponema sp.]